MKKGVDYINVAVVPFCHDGRGKYLFSLRGQGCRDEQGRWENAGGGSVEHGETLQDALVRELKEECNVTPFNIEYLGFREVFREIDDSISHCISFDFKVQIDPQDVKNSEPEKCDEQRWCLLNEIPTPMHSQLPYFLEKYKDQL